MQMFKQNTYIVLHTGKKLNACNSDEAIEKFCRAKYTSEKRLKDKFLSRRRSGEGTIHRKKKEKKERKKALSAPVNQLYLWALGFSSTSTLVSFFLYSLSCFLFPIEKRSN